MDSTASHLGSMNDEHSGTYQAAALAMHVASMFDKVLAYK